MFNNLKTKINEKYTTIAIYVISTTAIIFAFALVLTRISGIYSFVVSITGSTFRILFPVIIAVAIAYIVDPLVCWIEDKYKKIKFIKLKNNKIYRTFAVFTTVILIISIIVFLLFLFIFSITKQISTLGFSDLAKIITNYINNFSASLNGIQNKLPALNIESSKINGYISKITTDITNGLQNNLVTSTVNITSTVVNIILGLIISIYLLIDKEYFIKQFNKLLRAFFKSETRKKFKGLWKDFDCMFAGFIRGQLLDVLFMCVTISLTLSIIGIKFGLLIGIIAGLFNLIPYFGSIVAYIGTISFGLLNGQTKEVVIAVIALAIIQQIDAVIVGPKLMGNSVSLKPVFVMIAVIIGGSIGGMLGMIIAIPCGAFLKLVLSRYINNKLNKKRI